MKLQISRKHIENSNNEIQNNPFMEIELGFSITELLICHTTAAVGQN